MDPVFFELVYISYFEVSNKHSRIVSTIDSRTMSGPTTMQLITEIYLYLRGQDINSVTNKKVYEHIESTWKFTLDGDRKKVVKYLCEDIFTYGLEEFASLKKVRKSSVDTTSGKKPSITKTDNKKSKSVLVNITTTNTLSKQQQTCSSTPSSSLGSDIGTPSDGTFGDDDDIIEIFDDEDEDEDAFFQEELVALGIKTTTASTMTSSSTKVSSQKTNSETRKRNNDEKDLFSLDLDKATSKNEPKKQKINNEIVKKPNKTMEKLKKDSITKQKRSQVTMTISQSGPDYDLMEKRLMAVKNQTVTKIVNK